MKPVSPRAYAECPQCGAWRSVLVDERRRGRVLVVDEHRRGEWCHGGHDEEKRAERCPGSFGPFRASRSRDVRR